MTSTLIGDCVQLMCRWMLDGTGGGGMFGSAGAGRGRTHLGPLGQRNRVDSADADETFVVGRPRSSDASSPTSSVSDDRHHGASPQTRDDRPSSMPQPRLKQRHEVPLELKTDITMELAPEDLTLPQISTVNRAMQKRLARFPVFEEAELNKVCQAADALAPRGVSGLHCPD